MNRATYVSILLVCLGLLVSCASPVTPERSLAAETVLDATGFTGTMLIYSLNDDRYIAAHPQLIDTPVLPASTFKIFSSLVALQNGVVSAADEIIPWDGIVRGRQETNQDLTLRDAFQLSAVPHFQSLVLDVGEQSMQQMIDAAAYGNRNIGGNPDTFWLEGDLRITPRQQIELMTRLYREQLPFDRQAMQTVKDIMLLEETADYRLRAKTGLAVSPNQENTGWWVGWVERDQDVYFFATLLLATAPDASFIPARISVTRHVLRNLGYLP
tara:strand:- start:1934 stop:2743 length:810 start_codon:yes stop_codon:yes gene_type:complete